MAILKRFRSKLKRAIKKPLTLVGFSSRRHPLHNVAKAVVAGGVAKAVTSGANTSHGMDRPRSVSSAVRRLSGNVRNVRNTVRRTTSNIRRNVTSNLRSRVNRFSSRRPLLSSSLKRISNARGTKVGKLATSFKSRLSVSSGRRPVSFKGSSATKLVRRAKEVKALASASAVSAQSPTLRNQFRSQIQRSNLSPVVKDEALKIVNAGSSGGLSGSASSAGDNKPATDKSLGKTLLKWGAGLSTIIGLYFGIKKLS